MKRPEIAKRARDRGLEAMRFRLDGETFKQIGDRYGVTPTRAKVIVDKSMRLLHRAILGGSQEFDTPEKVLLETEIADGFEHEFVASSLPYRGLKYESARRN